MRLRLCLLLAASAVCAAEQMAHMHQQELQSEQSFETPVPHVMTHHHGVPILETDLKPAELAYWEAYNTTTFFTVDAPHKAALYSHVILTAIVTVVLYPVCLVLNNVKSSWYLAGLTVNSVVMVIGLMNYFMFMQSAPDLYPGNAYTKMSWILLFSTCIHWFFALLRAGFNYIRTENKYSHLSGDDMYDSDLSVNRCTSPSSTLYESPDSFEIPDEENEFKKATMVQNSPTSPYLAKVLSTPWLRKFVDFFGAWTIVIFNFMNWAQFFYHLIYIPTGVAVLSCFGQGKTVFNLLAHFIKGGVFFSLGLLYLSRYCGSFAGKGWAWNHKFVTEAETRTSRWARWQSSGLCTMEMVESSLILFYGCTNIFLEHLASPGGEWTAKDLQHASIAFIYIGCGLCGVITESKLASWRYERAMVKATDSGTSRIVKASPGFSPNPFPILTIFWTGILMSKHQQASHLSTEIHTQWGNMFILGCAFRFFSYILLLLIPGDKNPTKPLRLITELIVSFSLLCGGLIFMESCDPIILAFEYRGFTSMFTLNISLGVITLLMAWEMALFAFKDWLLQRGTKKL
ncbi:hypothetical protein PGUG_00914 [Meyerozyma guilliermondii ATCC 6260]|uniref:Protein YTP1-like C-terminal domain-containing protein n=2 Tax=cellular organisms TaxID=131567 RepID=A5DCA9_PICGU|nr:uncharacterized protein PGUG_00914 [Meyerozyma guilliermondii ATCC 6260]EDK36816.2 hypothetical protein PGUG_00914 [Meyerozyma guilliermondii ATCC 6260]